MIRGKNDHIRVRLDILRRNSAGEAPYWQSILYETEDPGATVAGALNEINGGGYEDIEGKPVSPIRWECGCLQKKCGACAMVIDGRPQLACGSMLKDLSGKKHLRVEPLRKFPVVADLVTDRSILFENLKDMTVWANESIQLDAVRTGEVYEASRCIQCGCCLEVCPNFCAGGQFFGAAGFVPASRLLSAMNGEERERIKAAYRSHAYEGCGKSLACARVCPAGIDIERLLVRSNALAWARESRRKGRPR